MYHVHEPPMRNFRRFVCPIYSHNMPGAGEWRDPRLALQKRVYKMITFDVFLSVLLPAPSPALPEAMAGATSMGGYLATARATQLVDIVR